MSSSNFLSAGMTNAEVLHQVEHGYRMQSPQGCAPALYDIMLECWHKVNLDIFLSYQDCLPDIIFILGPNEEAYFWNSAMEAGGFLHNVRLWI